MRAVLINDDKSLSLREVPDPVIKDDELFIKVMASGVNRADLLQREGNYPSPEGCPEWMGLEIAGVIAQMGDEAKAAHDILYKGQNVGKVVLTVQ